MFVEDEDEKKPVSKKKAASKKKASAKKTDEYIKPDENRGDCMRYVDLPSNGELGYPKTVEYRDMVVHDEKMLSLASEENYFRTMNKVLKSIMGNPDWFEQMATNDRDYMLVWIWANNYNTVKDIAYTCQHCNTDNDVKLDLTKLDVNEIDPDINNYTPFKIELKCGTNIWVNMRTVAHELQVESYMKNNDSTVELVEAYFISTIDIEGMEDATLEKKVEWVEKNVRVNEMAMIRMYHEHVSFGMDDQFTHTCRECGEDTVHTIPFRFEDFLQPAISDDFGKLLQANKGVSDQSD